MNSYDLDMMLDATIVTLDTDGNVVETWAQRKVKELEAKGRENWDQDDYEAWCYCEECFAEDARDAEYVSNYTTIF